MVLPFFLSTAGQNENSVNYRKEFFCLSAQCPSAQVLHNDDILWKFMAFTLILPPHQSHVSVTPLYTPNDLGIILIMQTSSLNSNFITRFNFTIIWNTSLFDKCLENRNCFYHTMPASVKFLQSELRKYSRLLTKWSASTVMQKTFEQYSKVVSCILVI